MIEKDYEFIIKIYEEYKFLYKELLNQVEDIRNHTVLWSNTYLEMYPFQYELNQLPKPKIYKNEPKCKEGIIVNNLKNNELYYSYNAENKGWGSSFIINEDESKICLRFLSEDDKMILSQVYCVRYNGTLIQKVLFYTRDDDMEEETFMIDRYLYHHDNNTIQTIMRDGFFEDKMNILPTRKFRFEYINGDVSIYSKQLKKDKQYVEELLYSTVQVKNL